LLFIKSFLLNLGQCSLFSPLPTSHGYRMSPLQCRFTFIIAPPLERVSSRSKPFPTVGVSGVLARLVLAWNTVFVPLGPFALRRFSSLTFPFLLLTGFSFVVTIENCSNSPRNPPEPSFLLVDLLFPSSFFVRDRPTV